jgi:hypothetical protein
VRLSLQDGDRDFLASFRYKIRETTKAFSIATFVSLSQVHDDYDDYGVLTTDYDKKMMLTHDYVSMFIHIARSTNVVTVEADVHVDYGRRTGYLSDAYWVAYLW